MVAVPMGGGDCSRSGPSDLRFPSWLREDGRSAIIVCCAHRPHDQPTRVLPTLLHAGVTAMVVELSEQCVEELLTSSFARPHHLVNHLAKPAYRGLDGPADGK